MGLNIKSPAVEADIRKLADRTGESLTAAVRNAVREKLARLETAKAPEESLEEHLAFLRQLQDQLKAQQIDPNDKRTARELLEELYDEDGLPK